MPLCATTRHSNIPFGNIEPQLSRLAVFFVVVHNRHIHLFDSFRDLPPRLTDRSSEQDEKNGSGRTFVAATRLAACLLPGNALHWPMFDVIQSKLEISGEQDSEPSWGAQSRSLTSGASVSKSPLSWEPLGHSTSAARFHTLYTCSTRTWGRNSFRCQITASSRPSSGSPTSPEERLQVRAHQPGQTEQGGWQAPGGAWLHPHAAWKQHGPRQELRRGYPGGISVVQDGCPGPLPPGLTEGRTC
ncbi:uncharacterized protein CCOS01_11697 [Colletotrichum costaricense]|uniref:Uncharacterized protein n=1 Tax=Colletotrichum costaricense TaxID=1209916 RepID=A0AAJ0DWT7_9PEZI|nr:uncharacterized protein CCOS01_11697 [Colletotrichum costaricense]KAK1518877.1 hypothetical protein CCOS01_11697 [Colletotrichum costaricense]